MVVRNFRILETIFQIQNFMYLLRNRWRNWSEIWVQTKTYWSDQWSNQKDYFAQIIAHWSLIGSENDRDMSNPD